MASTVAFEEFRDALDASGNSSVTFTSVDIGTAVAGRLVVVGTFIGDSLGSTLTARTTVAIGGNAMTKIVTRYFEDLGYEVTLWARVVDTGATANVVVSLSGNNSDWVAVSLASFSATGVTATAADTASDYGNNPATLDCDSALDSVGIGIAFHFAADYTWSGATENFDQTDAEIGSVFSGASFVGASTQTPRSISVTGNSAIIPGSAVFAVFPVDGGGGPTGQPTMKRMGGVPFAKHNRGVW